MTEIALQDFDSFIELMRVLDLSSSIREDVPKEQQGRILRGRLEQFAESYSRVSRTYFPDISERIVPYTKKDIGVWANSVMYQLRGLSEDYPQRILDVSDEVAGRLFNGNAGPEIRADIQPGGTLYLGYHNLIEQLPHKVAWLLFEEEIAKLLTKRLLDESQSPQLLLEHICSILLHEPSVAFQDSPAPAKQRFWQLLGYSSQDELVETSVAQLRLRAWKLLGTYIGQLKSDPAVSQGNSRQRGYQILISYLRRLYYWLSQLEQLTPSMAKPLAPRDEVFQYLHGQRLAAAVNLMRKLLPAILDSYHSLALRNFSHIAGRLPLLNRLGSEMLVEISHTPYSSDFLSASYISLSRKVSLAPDSRIYEVEKQNSVGRTEVIRESRHGLQIQQQMLAGAGFGSVHYRHQFGDQTIDDPNALVWCTRFPSSEPVTDQTYQILGHECEYLFETKSLSWSNLETGGLNHSELDEWLNRYYAQGDPNPI